MMDIVSRIGMAKKVFQDKRKLFIYRENEFGSKEENR